LPSAAFTMRSGNSAVSTPLSQIATLTGLLDLPGGRAMSRAAQMSGLSTLCAARYVLYVPIKVSLSGSTATMRYFALTSAGASSELNAPALSTVGCIASRM